MRGRRASPGPEQVAAGTPQRIVLAAPVGGELLLAAAPHVSERLVGQPHAVEPVHGDPRVGVVLDGPVEPRVRVHRHAPPPRSLDRVTEAHQPVRHHLAGAALHQIDQSAGVQVDEPSSELLRAAEAGLVQPQPGRRHTRRQPILDPLTGVSPHRPPIDAQLGGHLERRTGPHPLPRQVPQPLRRAGPRPDLLGGRGERPLRTPRLPAPVAALPPPHHHPPPERRRILHPHRRGPLLQRPRERPTTRTRRLGSDQLHVDVELPIHLGGVADQETTETDQHLSNVTTHLGLLPTRLLDTVRVTGPRVPSKDPRARSSQKSLDTGPDHRGRSPAHPARVQ